ncbi:cytochrome c [Thioalkalicoccus limnaeus]|uniref:Cytochrome c n=1 Tax=Thioalkalicoccus limnaeus TaxID=120681 RepID=A0ABV4BAM5_9GAMM
MTKTLFRTTIAILAASVATTAMAQVSPEDQIKFRQAGYSFMSWNMGKIKANLDRDYNHDQVVGAANAIAAIANSGMGALYGPGTERDVGNVRTFVKPEFFQNMEDVGTLARNFNAAANNLAAVAANGDQRAVSQAFGDVGAACKACHDKYRAD